MKTVRTLTISELAAIERPTRSRVQKTLDAVIASLPLAAIVYLLWQYYFLPNAGLNTTTHVYGGLVGLLGIAWFALLCVAISKSSAFDYARRKAPLATAIIVLFAVYDFLTLKTGILILPYFPWPDKVFNAIIEDRVLLLDCIRNSLTLLFSGYLIGAGVGLLCGVLAGWFKQVNYWVTPFIRVLGPIPSTTWLPIITIVATSLFGGSVFIIALGVWYPVTIATMTGVANVKKSFFEVARTLGASERRLIFRVAIPSATPNMFTGLMQGMSVACTTLMVAEMMGVESGLGWYINWQRGWAEFAKMYAAIIIICLTFNVVNLFLNTIKKRTLRWQEGIVK